MVFTTNKKLYVATEKGVLIFNGFNWDFNSTINPVLDVITFNDTLVSLSFNKLCFWQIKNDSLKPINEFNFDKNYNFSSLDPSRLIKTSSGIYIFSPPNCYLFNQNSLQPIDFQLKDLVVNNNVIYGITTENAVVAIKDTDIQTLIEPDNPNTSYKFLATYKNPIIISNNNIIELAPRVPGFKVEIPNIPKGLDYQNTFAYADSILYFSHTANYFYIYDFNSGKLHQLPTFNPYITKIKKCIFDSDKNIWLLYNEGIIMLSQIKKATLFHSGEFKTSDDLNIKNNISHENHLFFATQKPFYLSTLAIILYAFLIALLIFILAYTWKFRTKKEQDKLEKIIKERTAEILREKDKTDELIANLLPKDTATELKNTGKVSTQKFEMVTVLFSDIQGFTKIAEQLNPEKLIDQLDNFFFHFDSVVEKYNIEKIKTIGDAYMCAGGIPYKNRTNPVEVVLSALEMQDYMRQLKSKDQSFWDLRIGVHTGAVISGVVGHKRLSYDIWGDTVNTASRMESSGEAGKINISGNTYEMVKDFFICEYRGKMPVKYKGDIDMYFVKGIRPELSVDLKVIPNRKFFIQLQLLRLLDLEEFIIERMDQELTQNYFFHSSKHTKDVYTQTELLGRAEGLTPEEILITRTTALLLDIGFINDYHNHINHSVNFTREVLPRFKYSNSQTETVCNLLYASNTENPNPTLIESIVIDARYNYFGRVDYINKILDLAREIKVFVPSFNTKEFLLLQIERLKKFTFLTKTGRLLQEVPPHQQIKKLEEIIKLKQIN